MPPFGNCSIKSLFWMTDEWLVVCFDCFTLMIVDGCQYNRIFTPRFNMRFINSNLVNNYTTWVTLFFLSKNSFSWILFFFLLRMLARSCIHLTVLWMGFVRQNLTCIFIRTFSFENSKNSFIKQQFKQISNAVGIEFHLHTSPQQSNITKYQ